MIAPVQQIGVDLSNRLSGTSNIQPHRIFLIQRFQQIEHSPPVGTVVIHPDLLTDDPLLLLHCLLGEIGMGHQFHQHLHGLTEVVGAAEQIGSPVEGGISVGAGACLGVFGESVSILGFEHLVFQKMGDSRRNGDKVILLLCFEGGVNGADFGGKQRVSGGKALHRAEKNGQPRRMLHLGILLAQRLGRNDFIIHGNPPYW